MARVVSQRDGEVKVGIGAAGDNPQMPKDGASHERREENARRRENSPHERVAEVPGNGNESILLKLPHFHVNIPSRFIAI